MMNAIALIARDAGARRLVGEYVASDRNSMVRDHYARLGFAAIEGDTTRSTLDLERFEPLPTPISLSTAQT